MQPGPGGSTGLALLRAYQRGGIDGARCHASDQALGQGAAHGDRHAQLHAEERGARGSHPAGRQYIEPMRSHPLLATQCAVCRSWARTRICADCLQRHAIARPRCRLCAIALPSGTAVCGACVQHRPPFSHAVAAVDYGFPWRGLVAAFKFRSALDLAPALATLLADAARASDAARPALLLPVPLSSERLAERGMNQAWELARRVGAALGIASEATLLRRLIDTAHLADLPRDQRALRIRGAFGVDASRAPRLRGHCVALIDDVMTSGATASEAARTLLAAGAAEVQIWVLARTPAPGD